MENALRAFAATLPLSLDELTFRVLDVDGLMEIWQTLHTDAPEGQTCRPVITRTPEEARHLFAEHIAHERVLSVGIVVDGHLAGKLSLFDFNPRNRSAEFGYYLLPSFRRQNVATRTLQALLPRLFAQGLHKLYAQTAGYNTASIALLTHLGFHLDGVLRDHHERSGQLYDDHIYSLLEDECFMSK